MSFDHDNEFQPPTEKTPTSYETAERPNSGLALTSMVFGILGVTLLQLLGSIVAVATGHAALGQIRESEGRLNGKALAKVGLGLGYFVIISYLIAGMVFVVIIKFYSPAAQSFGLGDYERGVKMVNQMDRADFKLIEGTKIDVKEDQIIAYYNAGKEKSNPEFALLTTDKLIYLNDGRTTVFDLKDVVNIKDDLSFEQTYNTQKLPNGGFVNHFDYEIFHIEVRNKQGVRMRIDIQPNQDGSLFFQALRSAMEGAGLKLTPE